MKQNDVIIGKVDLHPSTNIVEVFSDAGYTFNSAIADIVDNCLTGKAKNIHINFNFQGLNSYITIKDDGLGMSKVKLKEALIYGFHGVDEERDIHDTGRYGVGLKTASSSFANKLIISSKSDKDLQHSFLIDFKEMKSNNTWEGYEIENKDYLNIETKTGTIVCLEDLKIEADKKTNEVILKNIDDFLRYVYDLEQHLSATYYYHIKDGLNIYINDKKVEGWCPFSLGSPNKNAAIVTVHDDSMKVNDCNVRIVGYVLPPAEYLTNDQKAYIKHYNKSLIAMQGFYFYRGKRLVSGLGGWMNIPGIDADNKYNYARIGIFVDNDLDKYLGVNFMKNTINPPKEFLDTLLGIAKKVRTASSKNYYWKKDPRPYIRNHKKIVNPWNVYHTDNGIKVKINKDHPTIKSITASLDERKKTMLFNLLEKNIPIGEFQAFTAVDDEYSKQEIVDMVEELYNDLISTNHTKEEILKEILNTAPFNDDKYRNIAFNYIIEREEKDDD